MSLVIGEEATEASLPDYFPERDHVKLDRALETVPTIPNFARHVAHPDS
ncbi:MAG: hypothetical protein VKK07_00865 [Merismopediaceae bacterium]|nr:hypothetical protein [Merismopediaceae bacterium]